MSNQLSGNLWEAFVGGEFLGGGGQLEDAGYEDIEQRTQLFYQKALGDIYGVESQEWVDAGGIGSFALPTLDIDPLERAEREFMLAIGDPFEEGAGKQFEWERLSRYSPTEAQKLLEGELYQFGDNLGGIAGTDYKMSMDKQEHAYKSGLKAEREGLTHAGLTSGVAGLSGTNGAVLRSGEAFGQAEDILEEASRSTKKRGVQFREGKKVTQESLETNLDEALTKYMNAIDAEKTEWSNNILSYMTKLTEGDDPILESTAKDPHGLIAPDFQQIPEAWEAGLFYGAHSLGTGQLSGEDFADESCGIGELRIAGVCTPIEDPETGESLIFDSFGGLCPSGNIDACGICDGDGTSCIPDQPITNSCGVIGTLDELRCWDGSTVCDLSECPPHPSDVLSETNFLGPLQWADDILDWGSYATGWADDIFDESSYQGTWSDVLDIDPYIPGGGGSAWEKQTGRDTSLGGGQGT